MSKYNLHELLVKTFCSEKRGSPKNEMVTGIAIRLAQFNLFRDDFT